MTTHQNKDDIEFECDECGELFSAEATSFTDAWWQASEDGWRARKDGNKWVHWCPDCK